MRFGGGALARVTASVLGTACALCLAAEAGAEDGELERELREMREMVLSLQDRVEDQQQHIEAQREVMDRAGLEAGEEASGLSTFLEETEFGGWVAASYFASLNDPDRSPADEDEEIPAGGELTGGGFSSPFHPDHNSLQFDELWFTAHRSADESSRAGFGAEVVYGEIATQGNSDGDVGGNNLWVPVAYAEYLTPIDVKITAGKFWTHIGYEVAGAPGNVTITRGFTYNDFQPVDQLGLKLSVDTDCGFGLMVGVTNGIGPNQVDVDEEKDLIWSLSYGTDVFFLSFNGEWGGDAEFFASDDYIVQRSDEALILDFVGELTPTDDLLFWTNVTFAELDTDMGDPWGVGVAVGGRVGVTERLGLGGRFEYGHSSDDDNVMQGDFLTGGPKSDAYAVTGVSDFALTENLTLKGEVKWEKVSIAGGSNDIFAGDEGATDHQSQVLLGAQMYYVF